MDKKARVLLNIYGRVQGVYFRDETRNTAQKLQLTGWVKNMPDGSVDCLAEGDREKLKQLINWCHEGSEAAAVEKLCIEWQPFQGEFDNFEITH